MRFTFLLISIFFSLATFGQLDTKNLVGQWIKYDSSFEKFDTLIFIKQTTPSTIQKGYLVWEISNSTKNNLFALSSTINGTEHKQNLINGDAKIQIDSVDYGIDFKVINENILNLYKFISLGNHNGIWQLKLIKADKLKEEKLYGFVKYDIFRRHQVLKLNKEIDTKWLEKSDVPIKPNPKLVVNGIQFSTYEILKSILFTNVTEFQYVPSSTATGLSHPDYDGVIIITIPESIFDNISSHKN